MSDGISIMGVWYARHEDQECKNVFFLQSTLFALNQTSLYSSAERLKYLIEYGFVMRYIFFLQFIILPLACIAPKGVYQFPAFSH